MKERLQPTTVRYGLWRGSAFVVLALLLGWLAWKMLPKFWRDVWQASLPEEQISAWLMLLIVLAMLLWGGYLLRAGLLACFYCRAVVEMDEHGIRVCQPAVWQSSQREWQLSWQDVLIVTEPSTYRLTFYSRHDSAPKYLECRLLAEGSDKVLPVIRKYIAASCLNVPPNAVPTTAFSYSLIRACFYLLHGLFFGFLAVAAFHGLHQLLHQHDVKLSDWLKTIVAMLLFGGLAAYLLWCGLAAVFCRRSVITLDGNGITVSNPAALFHRKWQIAWRDVQGISFFGRSFYLRTRQTAIAHITIHYVAGRLGHGKTRKIGIHALKGGADAVYHSALLYHAAHTKPAQSWRECLEQQIQELSSLERQLQGEIETLLKKQKNG